MFGLGDKRPVRVAAGVLRNDEGSVLLSDRSRAASMQEYWEFPGGKLRPGEAVTAALGRELNEELGVTVEEYEHLATIEHQYPDQDVIVDFFLVARWHGEPAGLEGQALEWVPPDKLGEIKILPADAPVISALQNRS